MQLFKIQYSPFSHQLSVLFNGRELTTNMYSSFALCGQQQFAQWFYQLPELCRNQAGTDQFSVEFMGEYVFAAAAKAALKGYPFLHTGAGIVTPDHRLRWAKELSSRTGRGLSLPVLRCKGVPGAALTAGPALNLRMDLQVDIAGVTLPADADVILVRNEADFYASANGMRTDRLKAFVIRGNGGWQIREVLKNCCLIECGQAELNDLLCEWYRQVLLPDVLDQFARQISGASGLTSMETEKRRLLTENKPYLAVKMPARIEISDRTQKFEIIRLPEDMVCSLNSSSGAIAGLGADNKTILPRAEGDFVVEITAKADSSVNARSVSKIYRDRPVTDIRLSVAGNPIEGDGFVINVAYTPGNADNTNLVRWSVSDMNCIEVENARQNRFRAKRAGACTVTLTVGTVSRSIQIQIMPAARDLQLDKQRVSVKLNDASQSIHATLLPHGAQGGRVEYELSDRSIVDVDQHNGQIIPKNEGSTVLTAYLVNRSNRRIAQKHCQIEVRPIHSIQTPDLLTVISIVILLAELLFVGMEIAPLFAVAAIITAGISFWRTKSPVNRIVAVVVVIAALMLCIS